MNGNNIGNKLFRKKRRYKYTLLNTQPKTVLLAPSGHRQSLFPKIHENVQTEATRLLLDMLVTPLYHSSVWWFTITPASVADSHHKTVMTVSKRLLIPRATAAL